MSLTVEHARVREASLHLVGYVRTSAETPLKRGDHADQLGAVRAAGCGRVFEDGSPQATGLQAGIGQVSRLRSTTCGRVTRWSCTA